QSPQLSFGYTRSAVVTMPTPTNGAEAATDASSSNDCYSVLAALALNYKWKWNMPFGTNLVNNTTNGIHISQIMATGRTAQLLASDTNVGAIFGREILKVYH